MIEGREGGGGAPPGGGGAPPGGGEGHRWRLLVGGLGGDAGGPAGEGRGPGGRRLRRRRGPGGGGVMIRGRKLEMRRKGDSGISYWGISGFFNVEN